VRQESRFAVYPAGVPPAYRHAFFRGWKLSQKMQRDKPVVKTTTDQHPWRRTRTDARLRRDRLIFRPFRRWRRAFDDSRNSKVVPLKPERNLHA
jgi:hypothetical protein